MHCTATSSSRQHSWTGPTPWVQFPLKPTTGIFCGCYTPLWLSSGLHCHRIGLIHPTHSGRSGCKDSFLLTGPFYSAILLSILLCSSRLSFTLRVHFTLSFSSTFHIAGPFYFALLHWGCPTAGWILRLAQSVGVG